MEKQKILELYDLGLSAREIREELRIPQSIRQIQRWLKSWGVIRTSPDSFRMAIKRGKVKWKLKENKIKRHPVALRLRYQIIQRDGHRCVACGATPAMGAVLEVDHIDNDKNNNVLSNLQTLCHSCNQGKYLASEYPLEI